MAHIKNPYDQVSSEEIKNELLKLEKKGAVVLHIDPSLLFFVINYALIGLCVDTDSSSVKNSVKTFVVKILNSIFRGSPVLKTIIKEALSNVENNQ